MTAIDGTVRGFSIAFYPPTLFSGLFFIVALAGALAAGSWLGIRFYLHRYGVKTEGRVTASSVQTSRVKSDDFSASTRSFTRTLTIEFAGPDGVTRTVKGKHYSSDENDGSTDIPKVGGTVPVFYCRTNPDIAVYYDSRWHYIMPAASLAAGLFFAYLAAGLCCKDIRVSNSLAVSSGWTEERSRAYQDAIVECGDAIYHDKNDADAYERRGDAQFATVQYGDAIADYSAALRLRPDRRELLLKRSKAKWLDGRDDYGALRDWLKSR